MANILEYRQTYWEQCGAKTGTLTAIHSGSDATIKTHYVDKLLRFWLEGSCNVCKEK